MPCLLWWISPSLFILKPPHHITAMTSSFGFVLKLGIIRTSLHVRWQSFIGPREHVQCADVQCLFRRTAFQIQQMPAQFDFSQLHFFGVSAPRCCVLAAQFVKKHAGSCRLSLHPSFCSTLALWCRQALHRHVFSAALQR